VNLKKEEMKRRKKRANQVGGLKNKKQPHISKQFLEQDFEEGEWEEEMGRVFGDGFYEGEEGGDEEMVEEEEEDGGHVKFEGDVEEEEINISDHQSEQNHDREEKVETLRSIDDLDIDAWISSHPSISSSSSHFRFSCFLDC